MVCLTHYPWPCPSIANQWSVSIDCTATLCPTDVSLFSFPPPPWLSLSWTAKKPSIWFPCFWLFLFLIQSSQHAFFLSAKSSGVHHYHQNKMQNPKPGIQGLIKTALSFPTYSTFPQHRPWASAKLNHYFLFFCSYCLFHLTCFPNSYFSQSKSKPNSDLSYSMKTFSPK